MVGYTSWVGCGSYVDAAALTTRVALLFSIQDFDTTVDSEFGQPVLSIFVDVFGRNGAVGAMSFVCVRINDVWPLTSTKG